MLLRFVDGRPVSGITTQFLDWCCERLAAQGKTALLLVWDNASWHVSGRVRASIKAHNRRVKREGGVRIVVCWLPVKAPWLNAIEPKWVHGKRAITEPERKLTGAEVIQREGLFVKRSLLVGIPEYHFIHGSCEFAGKLINVLYFEDLQQGLICIPSVGKPLRTQYARFTNQMLGRPLGSQDDRFKH